MLIKSCINQKIAKALKEKDEIRLSTLRLLSSALNYEFIAKQHELSEDEEMIVVQREIKKRKDAIEAYEKAKAFDRAEKEKEEMEILQEFLPRQLSQEEIESLVNKMIAEEKAEGLKDMGKVMARVMAKARGRVDGKEVSALIKAKLTKAT